MYNLVDIAVIIPTYNRANDLRETLASFNRYIDNLREVLIIDQSRDKETKKLIADLRNENIKYVHSDVPSLTAARNLGVKHASPKSRIILFLDDDVSLGGHYFDEILRVFNENPNALGASGYYLPPETKIGKIEMLLRKMFCIEHKALNGARVLSAYGAVYPSMLTKIITAEWLSGFNLAFKKEVFKSQKFDENLSQYALGEDFDFSYRIQQMRRGSLYLTPYARLVHRVSSVERVPTRKISYMNQIHHFYFNFKNFNRTTQEKLAFVRAVFGITILRTIQFMIFPSMRERLRLKFYFASLFYCLRSLRKIKKGSLRILE